MCLFTKKLMVPRDVQRLIPAVREAGLAIFRAVISREPNCSKLDTTPLTGLYFQLRKFRTSNKLGPPLLHDQLPQRDTHEVYTALWLYLSGKLAKLDETLACIVPRCADCEAAEGESGHPLLQCGVCKRQGGLQACSYYCEQDCFDNHSTMHAHEQIKSTAPQCCFCGDTESESGDFLMRCGKCEEEEKGEPQIYFCMQESCSKYHMEMHEQESQNITPRCSRCEKTESESGDTLVKCGECSEYEELHAYFCEQDCFEDHVEMHEEDDILSLCEQCGAIERKCFPVGSKVHEVDGELHTFFVCYCGEEYAQKQKAGQSEQRILKHCQHGGGVEDQWGDLPHARLELQENGEVQPYYLCGQECLDKHVSSRMDKLSIVPLCEQREATEPSEFSTLMESVTFNKEPGETGGVQLAYCCGQDCATKQGVAQLQEQEREDFECEPLGNAESECEGTVQEGAALKEWESPQAAFCGPECRHKHMTSHKHEEEFIIVPRCETCGCDCGDSLQMLVKCLEQGGVQATYFCGLECQDEHMTLQQEQQTIKDN